MQLHFWRKAVYNSGPFFASFLTCGPSMLPSTNSPITFALGLPDSSSRKGTQKKPEAQSQMHSFCPGRERDLSWFQKASMREKVVQRKGSWQVMVGEHVYVWNQWNSPHPPRSPALYKFSHTWRYGFLTDYSLHSSWWLSHMVTSQRLVPLSGGTPSICPTTTSTQSLEGVRCEWHLYERIIHFKTNHLTLLCLNFFVVKIKLIMFTLKRHED